MWTTTTRESGRLGARLSRGAVEGGATPRASPHGRPPLLPLPLPRLGFSPWPAPGLACPWPFPSLRSHHAAGWPGLAGLPPGASYRPQAGHRLCVHAQAGAAVRGSGRTDGSRRPNGTSALLGLSAGLAQLGARPADGLAASPRPAATPAAPPTPRRRRRRGRLRRGAPPRALQEPLLSTSASSPRRGRRARPSGWAWRSRHLWTQLQGEHGAWLADVCGVRTGGQSSTSCACMCLPARPCVRSMPRTSH